MLKHFFLLMMLALLLGCNETRAIREPASITPKKEPRFRFPEEEFNDPFEEEEFNKVVSREEGLELFES